MANMRAMVLEQPRNALSLRERPVPSPGAGEILVAVAACGVCRTDLHVVDGELEHPKLPIVPGHEIVGRVAAIGAGVDGFALGERVGVPWLGATSDLPENIEPQITSSEPVPGGFIFWSCLERKTKRKTKKKMKIS